MVLYACNPKTQEDRKLKVVFSYTESLKPAWATHGTLPCLFPGIFKASFLDVPIQFCGGGAILRLAEAQVGQVDLSCLLRSCTGLAQNDRGSLGP